MYLGYATMSGTPVKLIFSKNHNNTDNVSDAKILCSADRAREKGTRSKCVFCRMLKVQSCTSGDRRNTFSQSLVGSAENERHKILSSTCSQGHQVLVEAELHPQATAVEHKACPFSNS